MQFFSASCDAAVACGPERAAAALSIGALTQGLWPKLDRGSRPNRQAPSTLASRSRSIIFPSSYNRYPSEIHLLYQIIHITHHNVRRSSSFTVRPGRCCPAQSLLGICQQRKSGTETLHRCRPSRHKRNEADQAMHSSSSPRLSSSVPAVVSVSRSLFSSSSTRASASLRSTTSEVVPVSLPMLATSTPRAR